MIQDLITYPFLLKALLGALSLAILCGFLSPMIVAKRFAFMGASISHGALLGVSLAMVFIDSTDHGAALFLITLAVTLLGVAPLAYATFRQKLPNDALIGLFFTATMGLGLIINQVWGGAQGDLLSFLFGNILTLENFDLGLLFFLCLSIIPLILIRRRTWMLFLFDEEACAIQGINTALYHGTLFFFLTLVIVSGLKISGVILINSFLLTPGIFALKWAPNATRTFSYSLGFSVVSTLVGFFLANRFDLPTGATLAVVQVLSYFISHLLKRNP